eukprot:gene11557-24170_t
MSNYKHISILLWISYDFGTSNILFSSNYVFSCQNSRSGLSVQNQFCNMVSWSTARAYPKGNYSIYHPGIPLTLSQQDDCARKLFNDSYPSNFKYTKGMCNDAAKRFYCTVMFPECPDVSKSGVGYSYFLPCRLQCERAALHGCRNLNCDQYPSYNCMLSVPSGYFALYPEQGPYDSLPITYALVLAMWSIFAIGWNFATFVLYKDSCLLICRAVAGLPVIKVVVLSLGLSFWTSCLSWGMCSFWLGVSLLNSHLVYETGILVTFLLLAKGWGIQRETFPQNEWRGVIMSMSAFYMTNSIIL